MVRRLVILTQLITIQWVYTGVQDEPGTHWSESNGDAQRAMGTCQEDRSQLQGASTGEIWESLSIQTNKWGTLLM